MAYTVKQLAKLSSVSIRTLHWYDEKGLLKPAYIGSNGYRYYEDEQLLLLQQILFFRELEFNLNDIQNLLVRDDFDKLQALQSHKKILLNDIDRKKTLITTIDKTISHLRGKTKMNNEELYYGFDSKKQEKYEEYMVKSYGFEAEKALLESKKRTAKWDEDEWDNVKNTGDAIHKYLAKAIDRGLASECEEVQSIIERHYQLQNRFYDLTKDIYIGLASLYSEHPDFRKYFNKYHPEMIDYIGKAIKYYVVEKL